MGTYTDDFMIDQYEISPAGLSRRRGIHLASVHIALSQEARAYPDLRRTLPGGDVCLSLRCCLS